MAKQKKVLIVSDIHFPNHDPKAVVTFLTFLRHFKPHKVILNGDIHDFKGLSKHDDAATNMSRVQSETTMVADFLDGIRREGTRGMEIDLHEGNHDQRLTTYVAHRAPHLDGLMSLPSLLDLKRRRVSWMNYSADNVNFISPKLGVTHGTLHGTNYARDYLYKYGVSLIVGHAHRPQYASVPVVSRDGQHTRACWGLGCLVPVQHVSFPRHPSGWTQGWGIALIDERDGDFDVHQINLTRGRVRWVDGKTYGPNGKVG
jgi:UDP-2,3-diacylglucosamine pyrophosphatase LpxH